MAETSVGVSAQECRNLQLIILEGTRGIGGAAMRIELTSRGAIAGPGLRSWNAPAGILGRNRSGLRPRLSRDEPSFRRTRLSCGRRLLALVVASAEADRGEALQQGHALLVGERRR